MDDRLTPTEIAVRLIGCAEDGDRYNRLAPYPTAPGARTGLFVPALSNLFVALPHRDEQRAEILAYDIHYTLQMKRGFLLLCNLIAGGMLASPAYSQSASIRGLVMDESEAIVPGSQVLLTGASKFSRMATVGADGQYSFTSVPPGDYTIQSSAPGLALREPVHVTLKPGAQTVNLKLFVAAEKQQLTVEENAGLSVSTEAAANASAIVLRGADLDALSDNPDDLAADLAALAGPAAGPNGGATFIDGFSGGQLPSKESIREIRINQNPFSP